MADRSSDAWRPDRRRRDAAGTPAADRVADEATPEDATPEGPAADGSPDVYLNVPLLKVDEITLEVENLEAHVSLTAAVLDLLKLNVGADAFLGKVELEIRGVEAQALLQVRLDNVAVIINRVLTTLDRNPEILQHVGRGAESAARGVGAGAETAAGELGKGTGEAVEDVGKGAGGAVEDVGKGAGGAVEDVGKGTGEAAEAAGEAVGGAAQNAGSVVQGASEAAGGGQSPDANDQENDQKDEQRADASLHGALSAVQESVEGLIGALRRAAAVQIRPGRRGSE